MTVHRHVSLGQDILFLDGLTGTGKTMMVSILGSFDRVELVRFEHSYEYLFILSYLELLDAESASSLASLYADLATYNSHIGREVNLRPSDLSGAYGNSKLLLTLARLFRKDGPSVAVDIARNRPILNVLTHQALGVLGPAFESLGRRLRVVEMVRHPLFLIEHWYSYVDRFGNDALDFTVWIKNREVMPWFAYGWEVEYQELNKMDRVIYSIHRLTEMAEATVARLPAERRDQVLLVPFEKFVLDPDPFLAQIAQLIGSNRGPGTSRAMRRQKVPRTAVLAGPRKPIYERYGWKFGKSEVSASDELERRMEFVEKRASPEGSAMLRLACDKYETRFGRWYDGDA
jgi:hypothetical protein